jgi:hypothetical protein
LENTEESCEKIWKIWKKIVKRFGIYRRKSSKRPKSFYYFIVFRLLTDFVCLYNFEFWLSLCKIVRSSVILLLPLFTPYFPYHFTISSVFSISFHYSTYFSSVFFISFHYSTCLNMEENGEKIWKIQNKIVKWYGQYGRKASWIV